MEAEFLGREFGNPARLFVYRDAAFMGLLGMSLDPAVLHAAAVSVCGLAAKLADDTHYEGFARCGLARIGKMVSASATDRAVAILNSNAFPTAQVMAYLDGQEAIESSDPLRADEPTAAAYGMIVAHLADLLEISAQRDALHRTGGALGSLEYWRDAWTDRRDDAKLGRFNPFAVMDAETIRRRIVSAWDDFRDSLGSLPFQRNSELVAGVLATTGRLREPFPQLRSDQETRIAKKRRRKTNEKPGSIWHNCCDCPGSRSSGKGGCCDAAFDCGPGNKGCCDCNPCDGCDCCLCDGCDCCPCH